jgi:hypothetical protein
MISSGLEPATFRLVLSLIYFGGLMGKSLPALARKVILGSESHALMTITYSLTAPVRT